MSMNEKVAYLEGFIEGLDIDQESKEGRATESRVPRDT